MAAEGSTEVPNYSRHFLVSLISSLSYNGHVAMFLLKKKKKSCLYSAACTPLKLKINYYIRFFYISF